jgi:hypothetical protein
MDCLQSKFLTFQISSPFSIVWSYHTIRLLSVRSVTSRNMLYFSVSCYSLTTQAGNTPFVGYTRLFIQYIHSSPSYLEVVSSIRNLLEAPCSRDKETIYASALTHIYLFIYL